MSDVRGIRLDAGGERQRRRLKEALAGRDPDELRLGEVVADAQAMGSLELAGLRYTWEQVRAARGGGEPDEIVRLQQAQRAVPLGAPFGAEALLAWHAAASGSDAGFRTVEREREAPPPPAPAAFVEGRIAILAEWIDGDSATELQPAGRGALVLARLLEVLPFERANGRVARLAASHVMVAAGAEPPILVGGDAPRLEAALQSAFRLDTQPLVELLAEASERSLQVMLQALATSEAPSGGSAG